MKKLVAIVLMVASMAASAVTFEELGDSMTEAAAGRLDQGVVQEVNFSERKLTVGGYEYLVGPSTISPPVKVSLYGTSAGSFELLSVGMKVEIEYVDFGHARVAYRIGQLAPDTQVDH